MKLFDKVCGKIGLVDPEDKEELEELEEEEKKEQRTMESKDKVVELRGASAQNVVAAYKVKVIVIEPRTFDDAQQVANNLREKRPVVINFEKTDPEDAKRIVDFISGTTYALNGEIKKIGTKVFLCAPSNVNVTYTEEERRVSTEMPWLKK